MSETLLEYPTSSVFEFLDDEDCKTQQNCFELIPDSPNSTHNFESNYSFPPADEDEIAKLQKELSSPPSYTSYDDSSPVGIHVPNIIKTSIDSPSRFINTLDQDHDVNMDVVQDTASSSSPESESCRSPSPSPSYRFHPGSNGNSSKLQTVQILKDLDIKVREDELANMKIGELSKIAGVRFTKNEEKEIKRLRRKIKNKLSAAQSRQKMKDYVSGLEERVEAVTQLNLQLKQKVLELEQENKLIKQKLELQNQNSSSSSSNSSTVEKSKNSLLGETYNTKPGNNKKGGNGIYILMFLLSFGLFYGMSVFDTNKQLELRSANVNFKSNEEGFKSRSILAFDESVEVPRFMEHDIFTMDTTPLVDQSDTNDSNEASLWDSYLKSDLQFSNLDHDHDIVISGDPFCEDKKFLQNPSSSSSSFSQNMFCAEPVSPKANKIKSALESLSYVEKAYCGNTICVVRLESH